MWALEDDETPSSISKHALVMNECRPTLSTNRHGDWVVLIDAPPGRHRTICEAATAAGTLIVEGARFAEFTWFTSFSRDDAPTPALADRIAAAALSYFDPDGAVVWGRLTLHADAWLLQGESSESFVPAAQRVNVTGPRDMAVAVTLERRVTDPAGLERGVSVRTLHLGAAARTAPAPSMAILPAATVSATTVRIAAAPPAADFPPLAPISDIIPPGAPKQPAGGGAKRPRADTAANVSSVDNPPPSSVQRTSGPSAAAGGRGAARTPGSTSVSATAPTGAGASTPATSHSHSVQFRGLVLPAVIAHGGGRGRGSAPSGSAAQDLQNVDRSKGGALRTTVTTSGASVGAQPPASADTATSATGQPSGSAAGTSYMDQDQDAADILSTDSDTARTPRGDGQAAANVLVSRIRAHDDSAAIEAVSRALDSATCGARVTATDLPPGSNARFYAVPYGWRAGIYTEYEAAQAQLRGSSGNLRGFDTEADAVAYLLSLPDADDAKACAAATADAKAKAIAISAAALESRAYVPIGNLRTLASPTTSTATASGASTLASRLAASH